MAGITNGYNICRNIMRDNAASTNDCVITYGNTWHDDDAGPQPAALADMNGHTELKPAAT